MTTTVLGVTGMSCDHCVRAVTGELTKLAGVHGVDVDLAAGRVTVTLVTLDGHPLAGTVRISVEARGQELRVEVQAHERPATLPDFLVMRTLGDPAQTETWKTFVRNVVRESGGLAEVAHASEELAPSEARLVEQWADEMVLAQRRDESGV